MYLLSEYLLILTTNFFLICNSVFICTEISMQNISYIKFASNVSICNSKEWEFHFWLASCSLRCMVIFFLTFQIVFSIFTFLYKTMLPVTNILCDHKGWSLSEQNSHWYKWITPLKLTAHMAQGFFWLCKKWFLIVDLMYKSINRSKLCCLEQVIKCKGAMFAHWAVAELKWFEEHFLWPGRHRSTWKSGRNGETWLHGKAKSVLANVMGLILSLVLFSSVSQLWDPASFKCWVCII